MIAYPGNKRAYVNWLQEKLQIAPGERIFDMFSGSCVLSQAFRQRSCVVFATDIFRLPHTLGHYALTATGHHRRELEKLIDHLNQPKRLDGWLTQNLAPEWMYVHNAQRLDWIRSQLDFSDPIHKLALACVFVGMHERLCTWHQGSAANDAKPKYNKPLHIPFLPIPRGPVGVTVMDSCLNHLNVDCDIAFVDPPYNPNVMYNRISYPYEAFYNLDHKTHTSYALKSGDFQRDAFQCIFANLKAKRGFFSYGTAGLLTLETIARILEDTGWQWELYDGKTFNHLGTRSKVQVRQMSEVFYIFHKRGSTC